MRYELTGTTLKVIPEPSDDWTEMTAGYRVEMVKGAECLRCGEVYLKKLKKTVNLCLRLADKPELHGMVVAWKVAIQEEAEAKKAAALAELSAILDGSTPIALAYHDGEYLSGYEAYGQSADLLVKLGVAEEVSGWGVCVDNKLVEALSATFTYAAAQEFARPKIDAHQTLRDESAAKRAAIFATAKETGTPVLLAHWMDNCDDPREECSTDSVTEYAMPDGTTETKRQHTW